MVGMMIDMRGNSDEIRKAYEAAHTQVTSGPMDGLVVHTAGPTDGGFRIVDVWESREAFDRFAERMIPIAMASGLPLDTKPEVWEIVSTLGAIKSLAPR